MTDHESAFSIEQVTFNYGSRAEPALANVSAEIPAGTLTAILGLSASGKSTLLGLLGRIIDRRLTSGRVRYQLPKAGDGPSPIHDALDRDHGPLDYAKLSARHSALLRRWQFGFLFQSSYLLPNFTCRQNVEMPLILREEEPSARETRLEMLLAALERDAGTLNDLRAALDKYPGNVSGGQRQRVALLRALIHDPVVLFADEPCANLDPMWTEKVQQLLLSWLKADGPSGQRTVLLVSHHLPDAWNLVCHQELPRPGRLMLLKDGGLVRARPLVPSDVPGGADQLKRLIIHGDEPSPNLDQSRAAELAKTRNADEGT